MPHAAPKRFSSTQAYRPLRAPETVEDKDACGIYAVVNKGAKPSHDTISDALVALEKMLHRAGNVDGEGDGCGVLIDIPRKIWAEEVRTGGHASKLALDPNFAVVHVFIPRKGDAGADQGEGARPDEQGRLPRAGRARGRSRLLGARAPRPRGGARLLAGRRADRGPGAVLRPHARARGDAGRARVLVLHELRGLQGAGRARRARPLLPRPARRACGDRLAARPQPLLDEHLAELQARAALRRARPQRRDQHHRPPAPGSADAGRADPPRRLGLTGLQPRGGVADLPPGAHARGGDGADPAADRGRGEGSARRPPRLLHVPAPGLRPVRAGPGGADLALRRRARVLRGRARPAARCGSSRPPTRTSSPPSPAWWR